MRTSYQTPAMATEVDLAELQHRIDRLDSTEQIRQLVSRYALALDVLGATAVATHANTACAGLWQLAVQAGWVRA